MPTPPLTPEQFQRITRALGDPTRYEILRRIFAAKDCLNCGAAVDELNISPGTGSHHLHELEAADLINVTKDGRYKLLKPRRPVWRAYLAELRKL